MSDHIPDPTKMISDTPRMQSALLDHPDAGFAKIWQVGCDIERELYAANERIKNLESALCTVQNIDKVNAYQDLESANERIKRLEEAGDEMEKYCSDYYSSNRWRKAKEAKP
jgi:hypothetical protein